MSTHVVHHLTSVTLIRATVMLTMIVLMAYIVAQIIVNSLFLKMRIVAAVCFTSDLVETICNTFFKACLK